MNQNYCGVYYKWVIISDKVKVVLDLSYATKNELEHATSIDTSNLAAKKDFIALKTKVDKLNWLMFQLVWII